MKTITMNSITLELNEKHAPANRAALDELVRELKHNGGALFSASISATDATFNIEPKERDRAQYMIAYAFSTTRQSGTGRFFITTSDKMTKSKIESIEKNLKDANGFESVTIINFQELDEVEEES